MSCVSASSASIFRASGSGTPARLAAAGSLMSGPGCMPSSQNSRAAGSVRPWQDHANAARMSVATSPVAKPSSRAAASSPAMAASGRRRAHGRARRGDRHGQR